MNHRTTIGLARPSALAAGRLLAVVITGLFLAIALIPAARAHAASDAFLRWQPDGAFVDQRLDVSLLDLDRELGLDADGDGTLTWGEVRHAWPAIESMAAEGVQLYRGAQACRVVARDAPQLEHHADAAHAVLRSRLDCGAGAAWPDGLGLRYALFLGRDAMHRGLARVPGAAVPLQVLAPDAAIRPLGGSGSIEGPAREMAPRPTDIATAVVPDANAATVPARQATDDRTAGFTGFVVHGMHHIAIGADHLLFLMSLMLVSVWRRDGAGWVPRRDAGSACGEILRLVTAFTVSHSLTLALAATGVLAPPSRWIESVIAASVLVAALDNLRPTLPGPRWAMAAVFGLVHGFGFAGPLQSLGLPRDELALALLGFNLGVELGQLLCVGLLLPFALAWRAAPAYRRAVVPALSAGIAVMALAWLAQRSLDLQWG